MLLTSYDGPQVDSRTGTILHECQRSLQVEQSFQNPHDVGWKRSGKWGLYERGHCVLSERQTSQNTCIDGTFSSQPFLHSLPFHGGIGFGACLNSGANSTFNNVELKWRWDPNLYGQGIGGWECTLWTTRLVKKGEEFLWNYPPSGGYVYREFNPRVRPCELFGSSPNDRTCPNVPAAKIRATPVTAPKKKKTDTTAIKTKQVPFVAEQNPYGLSEPHNDHDDSDRVSSSGGSGSSPESSDNDDHAVQPQPFYEEFSFPIVDKMRKIRFDWEVKNEVASNVAPSLYLGTTKLHWKAIGLGGISRRKTELECFMLMDVPIATPTSHGLSILSMTNASIRAAKSKRGGDLTKSVNHIHHRHHKH